MPSYHDAFPSKWLKAADCNPPLILEIKQIGFEDVGQGTDVQRKLVVHFVERPEALVLNKTNATLLETITGTDDYDEWVGLRIRLVNVKVDYKGKLVDGIRVELPPPRRARPPQPPPPAEPDSDVGW